MARLILFVAAVVLVAMLLTGGFKEGPLGPSTTASIEALEADPGVNRRAKLTPYRRPKLTPLCIVEIRA